MDPLSDNGCVESRRHWPREIGHFLPGYLIPHGGLTCVPRPWMALGCVKGRGDIYGLCFSSWPKTGVVVRSSWTWKRFNHLISLWSNSGTADHRDWSLRVWPSNDDFKYLGVGICWISGKAVRTFDVRVWQLIQDQWSLFGPGRVLTLQTIYWSDGLNWWVIVFWGTLSL
jgi:hypothetical protein